MEDDVVMRYVKANPVNLKKCFMLIAEQIDRTPSAVANHWYTKVSKDPKNIAFFTASARHISKNRKNGAGEESTETIWKKFLRILGF